MGVVSTSMKFLILCALAVCASAQVVPYVHQEIAAEPYVHVEIPAEPYVHIEPALSPEALGDSPALAYASAGPVWTGGCVNSIGQGVPCRTQFYRKKEMKTN